MLFEYALDPRLLNNWANFRYYYESFGVSEGRLISRYPKHWERLVYESLDGCGEIERKKIVERLAEIKSRLMNAGRPYDADKDWLLNAEISHSFREFRAIIASANPRKRDFVLDGHALDSHDPRWKSETRLPLPRQGRELAKALTLLLQISRNLVLVDRHFTPTQPRFRNTLQALVTASRKVTGAYPDRIELLVSPESDFAFFRNECVSRLSALFATTVVVHVRILAEIPGGEKLHNRYILTERGGAFLGIGLDEGEAGESDDLALMSTSQFDRRWTQYGQGAPAFSTVYEFDVVGRL